MKFITNYSKFIVLFARIILGVVLIYSSFDKIANPHLFARDIGNYAIPTMGLENLMTMILPILELLTGLALVTGIYLDGAALISLLMMTMFILAISQAILRGIDIECGCGLKEGQMVGLPKLIEDIFYVLLSIIILYRKEKAFEIFPKSI